MVYTWVTEGKPNPGMMVNGMLAGLVAITAPSASSVRWAARHHRGDRRRAGLPVRRRSSTSVEDRRSGRRDLGPRRQRRCGASSRSDIFADGTANYGGYTVTGLLYGDAASSSRRSSARPSAFVWAFGVSLHLLQGPRPVHQAPRQPRGRAGRPRHPGDGPHRLHPRRRTTSARDAPWRGWRDARTGLTGVAYPDGPLPRGGGPFHVPRTSTP